MSYQTTTNLQLKKDNADEQIINWRTHNNDNLDSLDTLIHNMLLSMASVEDGDTVSTDYSLNDYIIHKGRLYKVIRAVASGTTIQVGSYFELATIGDILKALYYRVLNIESWKVDGVIDISLIPSLSAAKITSDTFSTDRIPSLPASKITGGIFHEDRIPSLSTDKLTSGTLPISRGGSGNTGTYYTTTVGDVADPASGCSISMVQYCQWGKFVHMFIAIKVNTAKVYNDQVATMKTGKLPKTTALLMSTSAGETGASIESSGAVKAKGAIAANTVCYWITTYILA